MDSTQIANSSAVANKGLQADKLQVNPVTSASFSLPTDYTESRKSTDSPDDIR